MALETLTVQHVLRTGAEVTYNSVTNVGGFRFLNDGKTIMVVVEKNTADCEVGITPVAKIDSLAAVARAVDVKSGKTYVMGPWPPEIYNDTDGYANFTIEADEAAAVAVLSIG